MQGEIQNVVPAHRVDQLLGHDKTAPIISPEFRYPRGTREKQGVQTD